VVASVSKLDVEVARAVGRRRDANRNGDDDSHAWDVAVKLHALQRRKAVVFMVNGRMWKEDVQREPNELVAYGGTSGSLTIYL
jgi:hypothetical protein